MSGPDPALPGNLAPSFEIRVPAARESLSLTREAARRVAAASGFDAVAAQEIAAAVDEAVTNVVVHAYRGEPGHEVALRFRRDEKRLVIEVEHRGDPPGELPTGVDLDRLAAERRRGGLGLHLMRRLMDTVEHRETAPGVGCWLLVRNRPPHAPSGAAPDTPPGSPSGSAPGAPSAGAR